MQSDSTIAMRAWLARRLDDETDSWLAARLALLEVDDAARSVPITLGLVPRRLPEAPLLPDEDEARAADAAVSGWDPRPWSLRDTARVLVLRALADTVDAESFGEWLAELVATADLGESVALLRGLPTYPPGAALERVAAEGLRSSVRSVFEAVAHHSPFPARHFDVHRWNHMILKALFVGSTLAPIRGLEARANPALADMLCDYARERRAAGRPVSPELWRCVAPHATGERRALLEAAAESGDGAEHRAAVLALVTAPGASQEALAARWPDTVAAIAGGEIDWPSAAAPH